MLTGTARIIQEAKETADALRRRQDLERRKRDLMRRRVAIERQIAELQTGLEVAEDEEALLLGEDDAREVTLNTQRQAVLQRRSAAE